MMRSCLVLPFVLFAGPILAQARPAPVQPTPSVEEVRESELARRKAGETGDAGDTGADGALDEKAQREAEELAKLTPEERLARNIIYGAGNFCRLQGGLKPSRLLPGQSGTYTVVMILQGDAVLVAPPPLTLKSPPQQGSLTLGGIGFHPAKPARDKRAKAFLGQPIYDDYAIFELPVTMANTAQLGSRHALSLELQFDLHSGTSGQPIGRFVDRVAYTVECGAAPDPTVAAGGAARQEGAALQAPVTPPEPVRGAATGAVDPSHIPNTDVAGTPAQDAPAPPPSRPEQHEVELSGETSLPFPLLLGAGGLLVAIVVLIVSRRRG